MREELGDNGFDPVRENLTLSREDFTSICNLNSLTSVITDLDSDKVQQEIKPYTSVIV